MKKKLCFFTVCLLTIILCITACSQPSNSGGSGNANDGNSGRQLSLQFSVDADLNGTYNTVAPEDFAGIYYITLSGTDEWVFGQNTSITITDNNTGASASSPTKIPLYKGTYEETDTGLILTKTHDCNILSGWQNNKVEAWKEGFLSNDKKQLNIIFTAVELDPSLIGNGRTENSSDDDSKLNNSITFPIKEIFDNGDLNGNCNSLTVNKDESDKYYMSFESGWDSTWEFGINETDSKGIKRKSPIYNGTLKKTSNYSFTDHGGIVTYEIQFSITHVYEVNEWVDYNVKNWKTVSLYEDSETLVIKFSDEELVSPSEEMLKNNELVENEIKAITESSSYVLTKRCKLSAVKKGLDYLKQNNPDIKIDLDLSKYPGLSIGDNAFSNCSNIKSVVFSENLSSIGKSAFADCTGLEKITISKKLTSLADSAFEACSSLTNVHYKGTLDDWCKTNWGTGSSSYSSASKTVFPVGYDLYINDEKQTEVTIPDTVTEIRAYLFANCTSLTKVIISDTVTRIQEGAFKNCTNLAAVIIPDSVLQIYSDSYSYTGSFKDCNNLTSVYYNGSLRLWCTASSYSYDNSTKIWNASVFPVAYDLYIDNKEITELTEESFKNITSLCDYAFKNCKSIKSVKLPSTITNFGSHVFEGCSGITTLLVDQVIQDNISIFDKNYITNIIFQDDVTSIGKNGNRYTFSSFPKLTSVTIPASVKHIELYSFDYCDVLENIYYGGTFEEWCNKNWNSLLTNVLDFSYNLYIDGKKVTELNAASFKKLSKVEEYAFYNCKSLTSVVIPDNIDIGEYAFKCCSNLEKITVGDSAMEGLNSIFDTQYIKTIILQEGVISIGMKDSNYFSYPFNGFNSLTSVTIPSSVTRVGPWAFAGCSALNSIIFEDTTTKWCEIYQTIGVYQDYESNKPMSKDPTENAELLKNRGYSNTKYYVSEKYTSD